MNEMPSREASAERSIEPTEAYLDSFKLSKTQASSSGFKPELAAKERSIQEFDRMWQFHESMANEETNRLQLD